MKRLKGFTLIEMVIVIIVAGILTAVCGQILNGSMQALQFTRSKTHIQSQGPMIVQQLCDDLSTITSRSPPDFIPNINETGQSTHLTFLTRTEARDFFITDHDLIMTRNGTSVLMAQNLEDFSFSFYNQTGDITTTPSSVHYVGISFVLKDHKSQQKYASVCYLRSLS
jgi:prepilin-type N-terminal cleavage/methylation domain-containing protein